MNEIHRYKEKWTIVLIKEYCDEFGYNKSKYFKGET